jgi:DNA-binding NarL/FixJ family response regulator
VEPFTLLLIDDNTELLHLLRQRLAHDGFRVITAESAYQALLAVEQCSPDLAIVNLLLSGVNSLQLAEEMKKRRDIPVIFLTPIHGLRTRAMEVHCCAKDYVVMPFEYEELLDRIRRVPGQGVRLTAEEPTTNREEILTPRQMEVLRLAASGATNNQIALRLIISAQTVNWHMGRIRARLGAGSRTEAVVQALQRGLLASK